MDLNQAIRTAYFSALDGNIIFNSLPVKIYDSYAIPNEVDFPYLILGVISSSQISVKRRFLYSANANLDIVTGSLSSIGRESSEIISEQIQNILIPLDFTDLDLTSSGYSIASSEIQNNTDIVSRSTPYYIFRKILNIKHLINKL